MSTIAAVATAMGEGGIAIVRLSGEKCESIMRAVFRSFSGKRIVRPASHRLYPGRVVDENGAPLDEAMAVLMRAPKSYTREDVLEIQCHGGYAAARAVLKRVLQEGAVMAKSGEFTRRAFENGRIDLSEAEAVMGIISAGSRSALRASVRELQGGVSSYIGRMRSSLTDILSRIEASDDFPDEIDEVAEGESVLQSIRRIRRELLSRADGRAARMIRSGVGCVICGRPNVGKSSLMNALLGASRAIVTDVAGTTRDVLTESVTIGGLHIDMTDTAGLRKTEDKVEAIGVERANEARRNADVVILVLDGSKALTEEDRRLLSERDERYIVALNKCDLIKEKPDIAADVTVSCLTGEGIERLTELIWEKAASLFPQEGMMTSLRHIECAQRAAASLERAQEALEAGYPLDVAAVDLWEARRILGEITGEDATEDVIDAVFRNFCVGK